MVREKCTYLGVMFFHKLGISANSVSVIALLLALISGQFYAVRMPLIAGIVFLMNGYLDIVDGDLARKNKKNDKRGNFVDHIFDRIADAFIFIGIYLGGYVDNLFILIAVLSSYITSYLGVSAELFNSKRNYSGFGRVHRIVVLFVFSIFYRVDIAVYLIAILSTLTVIKRSFDIWKNI